MKNDKSMCRVRVQRKNKVVESRTIPSLSPVRALREQSQPGAMTEATVLFRIAKWQVARISAHRPSLAVPRGSISPQEAGNLRKAIKL